MKHLINLVLIIIGFIPSLVYAEYSSVWYEDGGAASGSIPWYHPFSLGTIFFWIIVILACIAEALDSKKK